MLQILLQDMPRAEGVYFSVGGEYVVQVLESLRSIGQYGAKVRKFREDMRHEIVPIGCGLGAKKGKTHRHDL